jgi:hypothetical protein
MDAFEEVVAYILQRQGYWTRTSVKVELTKAEKRQIGRHSSPRWELDVVAYRGRDNELRVVECKSLLDSRGVPCDAFKGTNARAERRYKLFRDAKLRRVVLRRLEQQLFKAGFCAENPTVQLCLAAGKIHGDEAWLRNHFKECGWVLMGPVWIQEELRALRDSGYENSVAAFVTKLLLREEPGGKARRRRGEEDASGRDSEQGKQRAAEQVDDAHERGASNGRSPLGQVSGKVPIKGTTTPGFENQNGQIVLQATSLSGTDHLQRIYELRCRHCNATYGANGSDIHQRKCPKCQGGQPGLEL